MAAQNDYRSAVRFLKKADDHIGNVIRQVGPCRLQPTGGRFEIVARAIVSQQISVAAAKTIFTRLRKQLPGRRLSAAGLSQLSDSKLQEIGLSRQKRTYLRDLTERTLNGTLSFRRLAKLDDVAVIQTLTEVKGIGVWTAQMFLLFGLGRPDVFAPGDLGLQNAVCQIYGDGKKLPEDRVTAISERWAPYRSVASWYLWRYLELENSPSS